MDTLIFLTMITLTFFGFAIPAILPECENAHADQARRWIFYFGIVGGIWTLCPFIIHWFFEQNFWTTLLGYTVGVFPAMLFVIGTEKYFFLSIPANQAWAYNDLFFGQKKDTGFKVLRIFLGGFKIKYPWEILSTTQSLSKIKDNPFNFELEISKTVLLVSGVYRWQINPKLIQNYLEIADDETGRATEVVANLSSEVESRIGDKMHSKTIAEVMSDKQGITEEINNLGSFDLCERLGVIYNGCTIRDVNHGADGKKAAGSEFIAEQIEKMTIINLRAMGYHSPTDKRIPSEDRRLAQNNAMIQAKQMTGQVIDIGGLSPLIQKLMSKIGSK